ncbi:MAG: substrate-binding domain-containing protein [Jiangellaceae bacterium]
MARHRAPKRRSLPAVAALLIVPLAAAAAIALTLGGDGGGDRDSTGASETAPACPRTLQVVTASSFEPVLTNLVPLLDSDEDCVGLDVTVADGRTAAAQVAELGADVWIPDDTSWVGGADSLALADQSAGGSGTVVATSPIYMVTDDSTAEQVEQAGGGWLALADLVTNDSGVRLAVREPGDSGDGLVAVGAVAEAVWLDEGMDASAEALMTALPSTRTVPSHAIPEENGEVGLVAEYALIPLLAGGGGTAAATVRDSTILAGSDYSVVLRYTWLPTAEAVEDPALTEPLERVLSVLTGEESDEALVEAGLRRPDAGPPAGASDRLPEVSAAPFDVLGAHNADHVFAAWYPEDRRSDLLVVIDVSGSMSNPAPGSDAPLIDIVRDGTRELVQLLPDDSELALWEFGSLLDPPRDYRTLVPRAQLTAEQRQQLGGALDRLAVSETGTGLYDTILAAYVAVRDGHREGTPNHVVIFTDGSNEDDPGSISAGQLAAGLANALDPQRPVQLSIITFGPEPEVDVLEGAVEPVDGTVEPLTTADEVRSVFIHLAAGGVHH